MQLNINWSKSRKENHYEKNSAVACISQAGLFAQLAKGDLTKIASISTHQEYFPKGSLIRQPGDGKDGLIFLNQGSAKITT